MTNKDTEIRELEDITDAEHNHQIAMQTIRSKISESEIMKAVAIAEHAASFLSLELRERQQYADREDARDRRQQRRESASLAKLKAAEIARAETAAAAIRGLVSLVPEAMRQARKGKPALLRMILRATR